MAKARAGWEREIYYDSPGGATATTQLTRVVDINVNKTPEKVETTDRGTGGTVPKVTQQVVARACEITFVKRYWDSDTQMSDLLAAETTGTALAFKVTQYSGGETIFDGDCHVEWDSPGGLKDGMPVTFTLTPSQDLGRTWSDS